MKRFAALALLTVLCACGSKDTTAPDVTAGLYVLATVDNAPLPFTVFSNSSGSDAVTSGTIELDGRSWGFYSRVLNHRATSGSGTQTIRVSGFGVYTVTGSQIRFQSQGGDNAEFLWPMSGSISGGTITYAIDGHTYRFQKQ